MAEAQKTLGWADTPGDFAGARGAGMALVTDMSLVAGMAGRADVPPALLSPTPQDAIDSLRFKDEPERARFLRRRLLTRRCAALYLGIAAEDCVIAHGPAGRPVLISPGARLHLSVSARGGIAALAIARRRVGIDIELADAARDIPWNILRADERETLEAAPAAERAAAFLRLWCVKEAYVKALGTGLNTRPEDIHVGGAAGALRLSVRGAPVAALAEVRALTIGGAAVIAACVVLAD